MMQNQSVIIYQVIKEAFAKEMPLEVSITPPKVTGQKLSGIISVNKAHYKLSIEPITKE